MKGSAPATGEAISVADFLPHRYPFLLIDRVLEVSPGTRGRGLKQVCANEFLGPQQAMPALLMLEAGAQLLGLVAGVPSLGDESGAGEKPPVGYLAAVEGFQTLQPVKVGDRVEIEVLLGRRLGPLVQGEMSAYVGETLVAEGRLTAVQGKGTPGG